MDVLQKATLAVEESGVEAAAATGVIVGSSSSSATGQPLTISMVVNRPLLVAVVDVPTGAILFLGHIEDPTDAGGP